MGDGRPGTSAKDRALRLLGVRARSREELRRRLLRAGHEPVEVEAALEDLEGVGLVDDEAFARQLAVHQLQRRGAGRRGGLSALRAKGVDAELAERIVDEVGGRDEEARAEEVARRRASRLGGLSDEVAYQRLLGHLLRRGFEGSVARAACRRVLAEREAS